MLLNSFGELIIFRVIDVIWRGIDEFGNSVAFYEFGYIKMNYGFFGIEVKGREGFGEFGFIDISGIGEDEGCDWMVWVF